MTGNKEDKTQRGRLRGRSERLAAALRENLHRRKQQARGRALAAGEPQDPTAKPAKDR
jgi:hypothetical protein